jgi:aminocarboxymuconate-semialdehyde decarboxylase
MQTVDIHQHIVPFGFVERVRRDGAPHGLSVQPGRDGIEQIEGVNGYVRTLTDQRMNQQLRRKEMTAAGIDLSIQSISPRMMQYDLEEEHAVWLVRAINDSLAEDMKNDPEHVVAMGSVPMQFPLLAARELERLATVHGVPCVQIPTHVGETNLDDPGMFDFWSAAQELGMLIFVHPIKPAAASRLSRYHLINLIGNPLEDSIAIASVIFGGVLDRYPDLKLCFAHAGGYAPWIRGRWRHGQAVRPEAGERGVAGAFDDYFRMLYFDTIIHDRLALRYLVDTVGADRTIHGTDYPADMSDSEQVPVIRQMAGLSDVDKEMILGGNALNLITIR